MWSRQHILTIFDTFPKDSPALFRSFLKDYSKPGTNPCLHRLDPLLVEWKLGQPMKEERSYNLKNVERIQYVCICRYTNANISYIYAPDISWLPTYHVLEVWWWSSDKRHDFTQQPYAFKKHWCLGGLLTQEWVKRFLVTKVAGWLVVVSISISQANSQNLNMIVLKQQPQQPQQPQQQQQQQPLSQNPTNH